MGPLDIVEYGRTATQAKPPLTVKKKDMENIRRVFDVDSAGKKFCSIISPREDAQMFRSIERHTLPCECIVELYELLWRWGHRNTGRPGFAKNFGFAIPDTVVIVKGKPYAWYFISKKDGSLLRKTEENLVVGSVERKFCRERAEGEMPICATWMPMASQFPEARCHSQNVEFLTPSACREFLAGLRNTHSGIIQMFVDPHGVSNFLVRTVEYKGQVALSVRTNRSVLNGGRGNLFDRCATFEGWEGLSSSCGRYRSHKHPHMEELILEAGEQVNQRIEQEQVRKMLFLEPTQHVALHFKVGRDQQLYLIYASVVSEKDVILQTRPQLLMRDECMTEELPRAALLPGGADRKAVPHEGPACIKRAQEREAKTRIALAERALMEAPMSARRHGESLPPLRALPADASRPLSEGASSSARQRSLSARRSRWQDKTILPRMAYGMPDIPNEPFHISGAGTLVTEHLPCEYVPPGGEPGNLKRPLIRPAASTAPEDQESTARSALALVSARLAAGRSSADHGGGGGYPAQSWPSDAYGYPSPAFPSDG